MITFLKNKDQTDKEILDAIYAEEGHMYSLLKKEGSTCFIAPLSGSIENKLHNSTINFEEGDYICGSGNDIWPISKTLSDKYIIMPVLKEEE